MTETSNDYHNVPHRQSIAAILWPSFISAGVLTSLFFTLLDPADIAAATGYEELSRTAAYSIGFFTFWVVTALSSAATRYFLKPCELVNRKR